MGAWRTAARRRIRWDWPVAWRSFRRGRSEVCRHRPHSLRMRQNHRRMPSRMLSEAMEPVAAPPCCHSPTRVSERSVSQEHPALQRRIAAERHKNRLPSSYGAPQCGQYSMISHLSRSVAINTMIFQCGPYRNHSSASRAVVPVGVWRHKRTPLIRCGCQRSLRVVRISVAAAVAWDALCSAFLRPDSVVVRYMARQAADTPLRRPARLRSFAPACHRTRLRADSPEPDWRMPPCAHGCDSPRKRWLPRT